MSEENDNIWNGTETAPNVGDAPSGGGEVNVPPVTEAPAEPETTPTEAQPAATPPPAAPDANWTPERVAELLRAAREPGQPEQPQMSQEEMDRLMNVARVTPEDFQAILGGGENALEAFNKVLQAAVLQARTTAWYQTQALLRQHQQSLSPIVDYYRQAQQENLTNQFFNEHKEFQPDKHMKLLAATKASLEAEQAFNGKTKAECFNLISARAKELLSVSGTPLVPVSQPAKPAGMAQLSRGAGHGAAADGAASTPSQNATAKRFFGP